MNRSIWRAAALVVAVVSVLSAQGCRSMSDVVKDKDSGTTKVYPVDSDQAWKIAMQVFRWEGADAIEEHRDQDMMLTSSGMNFWSPGSFMGAWVEQVDASTTKVTVVTKRRIATQIATTLTETTFHNRFQQAVEIVKAGKPLPIEPPSTEVATAK
jgi:hypothetical protein